MENNFKGTPSPWYFKYDNCDHSPYEWYNITSETNGNILNRRYSDRSFTDEQMKANALLISKAPEMLEMLIKCKVMCDCLNIAHVSKELERLIKQATEL